MQYDHVHTCNGHKNNTKTDIHMIFSVQNGKNTYLVFFTWYFLVFIQPWIDLTFSQKLKTLFLDMNPIIFDQFYHGKEVKIADLAFLLNAHSTVKFYANFLSVCLKARFAYILMRELLKFSKLVWYHWFKVVILGLRTSKNDIFAFNHYSLKHDDMIFPKIRSHSS